MARKTVTDMDEVRKVAHVLLDVEVEKTRFSPIVVTHPFTNTGIVAVQDPKMGEFKMLNIVENEDDLKQWREMVSDQIDQADKPYRIFVLMHPAYAMTFLKYAGVFMSDRDFANILGNAWVNAENANADVEVPLEEQIEMFRRAPRTHLMTGSELKTLRSFPEEITAYRGVEKLFEHELHALSWTTNVETAKFFASRFLKEGDKQPAKVYAAKIRKEHILAYFDRRDESEVIADPEYLTDIHPV